MANPARIPESTTRHEYEESAPPRVYSYTRFSSSPQERGDSLRRQVGMANEWAAKHGHVIESLTLHDAGLSAYRGRNTQEGSALATFLSLVQDGTVPQGSILLVESLDRVSRQTPRKALRVLESIVDKGITVVTLSDNRTYTAQVLDSDPLALFASLMYFIRSFEESDRKASRIRSVWQQKRESAAAHGTPLTAKVPGWLRREGDKFVLLPDRVAVVKRIFKLVSKNVGLQRVADLLNADGIKPFGTPRVRKDGSAPVSKWHRSAVLKVVTNPAVIGIYVPHTLDYSSGRRVRRPGVGIRQYFPACISQETWERVMGTRAIASHVPSNRTTKNLLGGGLLRCARCSHCMTRTHKGPGNGVVKLRCTNAECDAPPVPYDAFEARVVEALPALLAEAPLTATHALEETAHHLSVQIDALDEATARLLRVLEEGEGSGAVSRRLRVLEGERLTLEKERKVVYAEIRRLADPRVARQLRHLSSTDLTQDRAAANLRLRSLISSIVVDSVSGTATVAWSGAVESSSVFTFAFPTSSPVVKPIR
jgi:DNA invertase Pin-like site-specific DNA recombinase